MERVRRRYEAEAIAGWDVLVTCGVMAGLMSRYARPNPFNLVYYFLTSIIDST